MRPLTDYEIVQAWEWAKDKHAIDQALYLLSLAYAELSRETLTTLSIGQRNTRLLTLREKTIGPEINGLARCPQCNEAIEFTVATADLWLPEPVTHAYRVNHTGFDLHLRLPNSQDLAAIIGHSDVDAARRLLLERCVVAAMFNDEPIATSDLPDWLIPVLADVISEHDPLSEMRFRLLCPDCGNSWSALFDIVTFFWTEVTARARRLLSEVAVLARAYGWREADILLMGSTRRQYYLEMVT